MNAQPSSEHVDSASSGGASASSGSAIASNATSADALCRLAVSEHESGNTVAAENNYRLALAIEPGHIAANYLLGLLLFQAGQTREARGLLHHAAKHLKHDAKLFATLGGAYQSLEDYPSAVTHLNQSLELDPSDLDARLHRGICHYELESYREAIEDLSEVTKARPRDYDASLALANAHLEIGEFSKARAIAQSVIDACDQLGEQTLAMMCVGDSLFRDRQFNEAFFAYKGALEKAPDHAGLWFRLGMFHQKLEDFQSAIDSYRQCLKLEPENTAAMLNLGISHNAIGDVEASEQCYRSIITLNPQHHEAHWNLALVVLSQGRWQEGFELFEARWHIAQLKHQKRFDHLAPRLTPSDVKAQKNRPADQSNRLLIWAEQGLGDTIQFCRFAPYFHQAGFRTVLLVPASLRELCESLSQEIEVISTASPLDGNFDFQAPLLSLPYLTGDDFSLITPNKAYLSASTRKRSQWETRITPSKRPKVGLCFSGSPTHLNDHNRSLPAAILLSALPEGIDYYCLQKDIAEDDRVRLHESGMVQIFAKEFESFSDTAALCSQMQLVVSVDTSICHLAGALGVKTILLLPYLVDWRWGREADNTAWYGDMTLIRQHEKRSWASCIEPLRTMLESFVFNKK